MKKNTIAAASIVVLLFLLVMVWAYAVKFSIEKEVTMEQDIKELEETVEELAESHEVNEALRDRVVELTAENEWLKNRNEVLEESE